MGEMISAEKEGFSMKLTELFLTQLETEAALSRRALERVPEGRNDWKPHEKSMQLGYLAATGVGTGSFVILCAIAWMYSNKTKVLAWWDRRRARRRGRPAAST